MSRQFTINAISAVITFALFASIVLFFYYNDRAGTIFAQHLRSDFVRQAHIEYDSGYTVTWVNEREGTVVGTVSDSQARRRTLQSQPFTDCSDRCENWAPTDANQLKSVLSSVTSSATPDDVKRTINTILARSDTRCAARFSEGGRNREVLCLSPSDEKFVYSLLKT